MGSQKTFQDYIWQEKATKHTGVDDLERKKVYHVADLASSASSKVTASSADLGVVALLALVTMAACSTATLTTLSSTSNLFTVSHTIILGNYDDDDDGILLGNDNDDCRTLLGSGGEDGALGTTGELHSI